MAVGRHRGGNRSAPVLLAGHVQVDVGYVQPGFGQFGLNLAAQVVKDVADDYLGAFLGHHAGFHGPLAPRSAADNDYFAVQPAHINSLPLGLNFFV